MQELTDSAVLNDLGIVRSISVRKTPLFPDSKAGKNLRNKEEIL